MASSIEPDPLFATSFFDPVRQYSLDAWIFVLSTASAVLFGLFYAVVYFAAPVPRPPRPSEKTFVSVSKDGSTTDPAKLPSWLDDWKQSREQRKSPIDQGELFMSVVVPAYNEEKRLGVMLEEAVAYLNREHRNREHPADNSSLRERSTRANGRPTGQEESGWEILVVSDGSTDDTCRVALDFAKANAAAGSIRVVRLEHNRGKGAAVVHGLHHVRGKYVVFADADGASKFEDLHKLVTACQSVQDRHGRAIAVGSRAHLVGSEAVVKRSRMRNFLMHSFHLLLWLFTPPATSRIRDTQCGFKLLSRPSLPFIVPFMHSERWIFDVEMLMLAEKARIPMKEVAVTWKEVQGSKLNPFSDSLGMAWGLFILRAAWALGIYSIR